MRYLIVILAVAVLLLPLTAGATEIPGGPVYGDWFASGNPYNVNGEITVPFDSTLNIHEGVEVIFQGHYKLIVNGYLEAIGTETDSILFTAADTSAGWHGIRFIWAPDNSHLSYCIIQYGKATGTEPDSWGGGIYCDDSSPVISDCTIRRNWAEGYIGGLGFLYSSNPTISHCLVTENSADTSGGGISCGWGGNMTISDCTVSGNSAGYGYGGIAVWEATATIENCTVSGNSAGYYYGGIAVWEATATIENCTVIGNTAGGNGGGIFCWYSNVTIGNNTISGNSAAGWAGAGIYLGYSSATIRDCIVSGNTARWGGGIFCWYSSPTISNNSVSENSAADAGGGICCWYSSPTISNNSVSENSAANSGGGIYCEYSQPTISNNVISRNSAHSTGGGIDCHGSSPAIRNNTIVENSAGMGGGICCAYVSNPIITNSICWEDSADYAPEIWADTSSSPLISYCNIQDTLWPGTGNIDADPMFAGLHNEDYYLRWHSPCIDAGDPDPQYNDPDGTRNDMGCFYFNQDVDGIVEVYPLGEPIVIPPEGGDLIYDGWVFNFFGHAGRVDIWTYAFVPEMGQYGPLDLYENVRIPADSLGMNEITQHVPGAAPEGEYVFVAYVGEYPGTIIDSSCFYFTKTGSVAGGTADWQTLKGWFDGDFASTGTGLPTHYALSQNYPNPFNATTIINYQVPVDSHVRLEVYNTLGQKVATLLDSRQQAGYRSVLWDASTVSSGLYLYKLTAGDFTETRRMMLVK